MDISKLTTTDRIILRDKLNKSLPGLEAISLQHELTTLFSDAKDALEDAFSDPDVNTAPVINAVTALIKQMTVFQSELYSSERQKRFEEAVIEIVKQIEDPEEFLKLLEESLDA